MLDIPMLSHNELVCFGRILISTLFMDIAAISNIQKGY